MKKLSLSAGFFALLLFVSAIPAFSQSQLPDAHVLGTLTDPSGAGIGGVQVTAQLAGAASSQLWSATSTADGAYRISLPPGRYVIHFSRDPFASRTFTWDLSPGESRTVDLRLALERLSSSVVVTAEAEPVLRPQSTAPTDVLTREVIDQRQSVSIPDLLQFSPGVAFARTGANGGTASLFLDGGNSNFTKVLVDGAPINPPGGAVDFSLLTLDNVDKVEIVRGAESALYGTDAVSGVVQLFSHRGTTRIPSITLFGEGGSYANGRGGGQISGLLGTFDYSGAASYLQTDGQGPNDDFLNRALTGNFGYAFSDTNHLRLTLRNNTSDAGIPGQTVFEPPSLHQQYDQRLFSASARWEFVSGDRWHYQLSGSESYTHQHSFNPEQSFYIGGSNSSCPQTNPDAIATTQFCDYTYDDIYNYNRAGFSAQTTYILRDFAATAGYQYEVENGAINYLAQTHVRRNNQAGFLDFRYLPHPRISLNLGVRAEDNGNFGTRVVPRAGASLALRYGRGFWGDTRYRAFYGEGIKEPRFDQLYSDQFGDIGNPSLKPEASKNWSTGFEQKLANDRAKVTAEYFSNRFYNIISFAFCSALPSPSTGNTCGISLPGAPPSFGYYFNTDLARARGTNIAVEARATKWLFVTGNYTYDDSLILKSPNAFDPSLIPGNRLARRPANSGSITFTGTFRRFNATLAGYFTGQRTDSDFLGLGYTRDPGYVRVDLAANYNVTRSIAFTARATNLFDKQYQDALGYPALGRDYRFGLRYQFAGHN
ncbi:MAG: TonB-dependent receptor [Candidatus Acidiferrum sp.]